MYFCVSYALGYFHIMNIYVRHDIMQALSLCCGRQRESMLAWRVRQVGPCAVAWVVCRELLHIQPFSNGKEEPKTMPWCFYEIDPTILHVFAFFNTTVGYLLSIS